MGQRLPIAVVVVLVAASGLGIASVYLPWESFRLLGAVISVPGSNGWTGQVTAVAFGVLATACVGQFLWPRLPRLVPLAVAILVGGGVMAVTVWLLLNARAEMSVGDGGPPVQLAATMGSGGYLAMSVGLLVALLASWQLWRDRRPLQQEPPAPNQPLQQTAGA